MHLKRGTQLKNSSDIRSQISERMPAIEPPNNAEVKQTELILINGF